MILEEVRQVVNSWFEPHVEQHLIAGEKIVHEVRKHWVASIKGIAISLGGGVCFLLMPLFGVYFFIPLTIGVGVIVWGLFEIQVVNMDRFVVTSNRVFRVHGVFGKNVATMPMKRVLDVSFSQSWLQRVFGYGHFVFESAAQKQGLKDIKYVPDPHQLDLTIQRVLAASGLHAHADLD